MRRIIAVCVSALLLFPIIGSAQSAATRSDQPAGKGLSTVTRQKLIASMNKGVAYLLSQQKPDGTWENNAGITAMAAGALLRQPGRAREDALRATGKTLDYLHGLAKPDGGIYEKDVPHYVTAVSVMALVAGGRTRGGNTSPSICSMRVKASSRATSSTVRLATALPTARSPATSSVSSSLFVR